MSIHLCDGLCLPLDTAASQKYAFLGRSGSGKSYAAGKLVEELLAAGSQVVVVDPVGIWFGLRLAEDGKSPGISIPILGGSHGDYPLESTAGALVADFVVETGASIVLDVSEFTGGETRRFVAEFATKLLQLKKKSRSPLLVVWEEAQEFVPQRVFADAAKMVGALERLVKIGRNFGVGTVLISQRPQSVNKDVLNQSEVLFVYQLTGPQERKAIEGWITDKALDLREQLSELPGLPPGTGYVWSPQWLGTFRQVRVDRKRTFDASATPMHSTKAAKTTLAPIDLDRLQEAMNATIERAKGDDPRELRRRIKEMEKLLEQAPTPRAPEPTIIEVMLTSDLNKLSGIVADMESAATAVLAMAGEIRDTLRSAVDRGGVPETAPKPADAVPRKLPEPPAEPVPAKPVPADGISNPQQRILDSLAELSDLGLTEVARANVAVFAGQSPKSSGFGNNLGRLSALGLINYPRPGQVALTAEGRVHAVSRQAVRTVEDLHAAWLAKLPRPRAAILRELIDNYPAAVDREALARLAGQSPTSSGYGNNLGALRSLGLIDYPDRGRVAATALLFPDGMRGA